jgi:ketosteroid isomerase-like protein
VSIAKDVDACVGMCTDDIVYMPADQPVLRGREALQGWLGKIPPILNFGQEVEQVEGGANRAYVRATAAIIFDVSGNRIENTYKMMCSFRKNETGTWLMDNVCWNSDRPMGIPSWRLERCETPKDGGSAARPCLSGSEPAFPQPPYGGKPCMQS